MAISKLVGASVQRVEDPALITGRGTYVDDIKLPGMLHMAVFRSTAGHARIRRLDVSKAAGAPGVVAVLTADDVAHIPGLGSGWSLPGMNAPGHPLLGSGTVRYVGEPLAVVVAADRYSAKDALELIEVDYDPLPAVTDPEKGMEEGAPQLHENVPRNIALDWTLQNGDAEAAFARADRVVEVRVLNQRVVGAPLEGRGVVARFEPGRGQLTVWTSTQVPYGVRNGLASRLGLPLSKVRVIAPDVGGGFGLKLQVYPEEILAAHLAMKLRRPVKWIEERSENFVATSHGRDQIQKVKAAVTKDGRLLGLKVEVIADLGAYSLGNTPGLATFTARMAPGIYDVQDVDIRILGVLTNKTPHDAYRGAGRPEGTYLIERTMDAIARELGLDPAEVRRRNFIPKDRFPYRTATGLVYDSGDYNAALDLALEKAEYHQWRRRQEELRRNPQGKYLGIGISTYVEISGLGPSKGMNALGAGGGHFESGSIRVHPNGHVTVITGTSPHGQGHRTAWAQIVSDELGVPMDQIEVLHGDTDVGVQGVGTHGSRSAPVGGTAVYLAAGKIKEKARRIVAHVLEASPEDVVFENGRFFVRGTPAKAMTLAEVAGVAYAALQLPEGMEPGLEATTFYDPPNFTFPFGAHVCVVEVDAETFETKIVRYISVDDCGRVINPLLVEGQVHGGLCQGIAQALYEEMAYDENAQPLTGTFMTYAIPTALEMPSFELYRTITPSPANPLGVKGVGEAATIGSTPAVVNAVVDALSHLGIRDLDMPLKPHRLWEAVARAQGNGA